MTTFLQGINDGLADGDIRKCDCALCDGTPDYRNSVLEHSEGQVGEVRGKKCPECAAGKHQNCDGIADLDDDDQPVPCSCDSDDEHPMRQDLVDFSDDYLTDEIDEMLHQEWTGYGR